MGLLQDLHEALAYLEKQTNKNKKKELQELHDDQICTEYHQLHSGFKTLKKHKYKRKL